MRRNLGTIDPGVVETMKADNVRALSVRELVRRRRGDAPDQWHLALVQRGEVWDQVRMRYLLDSLLSGYPIGSLLVCTITGQSRVIHVEAGQRTVGETDSESWQLLDGQQRINALFSMFTPEGRYGRFYLNMTARRVPTSGPLTQRGARDTSVRYIHWQDASESDQAIPSRDRYIDLSRWYEWAEGARGRGAGELQSPDSRAVDTVQVLNSIDPEFTDHLDDAELEVARTRLQRLKDVWERPVIPVQYLALGSPHDVLEVFTRINRTGVQVAGDDLFFAAVKTLWPVAEQTISQLVTRLHPRATGSEPSSPLVGRLGALRLLARLAARAVGESDLVPLTVDRLSGHRGAKIIDGMSSLSEAESISVRRMSMAVQAVTERSALGFGLYSVDERLWDDLLGWAAVNPNVDKEGWLVDQMRSIDAYLMGATAFRYPALLRDRFARVAMTEALASGVAGETFPTQRIAEVTRTLVPGLRDGRATIRGAIDERDKMALADDNASLFLSVLQQIPYKPQRDVFDWDHIFPQAKASLMWSPGPDGRWRRHHQYRRFVSSAGNLWGLDAGVNRAAQDMLPLQKFELIETRSAGDASPIWPRHRWLLSESEIEEFGSVGQLLSAGGDIDPAMTRFHGLVTTRAIRMTNDVLLRFPEAASFAADATGAGAEPRQEPRIAEALGIDVAIEATFLGAANARDALDSRVEKVLRLADERGSGGPLRAFVRRALALGLQVRGYSSCVALTPPRTRALSLITLAPADDQLGVVKTWVAPRSFADHFRNVSAERFDQELGGLRGILLDGLELDALARRLERVLAP
jgi:hypothetical protein